MLRQTRNRKENILNNCHIVGDAKKEGKVGGSEEVRQDGKSSCQRKDLSEREKPIKINFQDAKRNLKLKTRSQSKYYQPKPHFGRLNYIKCVILVTLRFFLQSFAFYFVVEFCAASVRDTRQFTCCEFCLSYFFLLPSLLAVER